MDRSKEERLIKWPIKQFQAGHQLPRAFGLEFQFSALAVWT
jgi:hypothetical protein